MVTYKVHKTKDYTVMSNVHLRDKNMSLKAKGLLSMMLSLPEEWDYSMNGLVAISKENLTAIRAVLQELEKFGYLIRERKQNAKGRFEYEYHIYEVPHTEKPYTENPYTDNPYTDKPYTENVTQLNTNKSITDKLNTNKSNTEDKEERKKEKSQTTYDEILSEIQPDDLRDLFFEYIKMRKMIKSPMTDRALKMLINRVNELEPNSIERQKKLLETAIMNNWKSVYPLKDDKSPQTGKASGNIFLDIAHDEGII